MAPEVRVFVREGEAGDRWEAEAESGGRRAEGGGGERKAPEPPAAVLPSRRPVVPPPHRPVVLPSHRCRPRPPRRPPPIIRAVRDLIRPPVTGSRPGSRSGYVSE
ncbi:hypothetical protein JCM4914_04350 [Streptomyces platensis subsp. malvinus]